jgi:3-hydroxybutyryl-CoA dehydratase
MNEFHLSDMHLGKQETFSVTLTEKMFQLFQSLSGDSNPLHQEDSFAQSKGFPSKVAYGLLTSSFYSKLVGVHLPGKHCLLQGIEVSFKCPAYIGDHLQIYGEVSFVSESVNQVEIKAKIINQKKQTISTAIIKVSIRE